MQKQSLKTYKNTTYELDRSLSYSRVTAFAKNGPYALINVTTDHSYAMSLGSLTDDFLNENVDVESKYYIYDGSKPTATLGKLCNLVIENFRETPSKKEVFDIVKKNGYWSNVKNEKILYQKFDIPEFWDYINVIINENDKEIITSDMYLDAEDMSHLIKTHPHTSWLFNSSYKRVYQYYFEITIKNVAFKGAIDYIAIDKKNKTVEIVDFKTGSDPAISFSNTFISYRYFIQEAIYTKAFRHICKKFNLKGFKLKPFKFVYISRSEKIPVIYTVTKKWHRAALKGFTTRTGYTYKGLYDIIDDIKWHYNNRVFDMPRYIAESEGNLNLNDDLII
jgi:hypothetical protein